MLDFYNIQTKFFEALFFYEIIKGSNIIENQDPIKVNMNLKEINNIELNIQYLNLHLLKILDLNKQKDLLNQIILNFEKYKNIKIPENNIFNYNKWLKNYK